MAKTSFTNTGYITNTFDTVGRLLSTRLNNSSHTTLNSHGYQLDTAHQRWRMTRRDNSTATYTNDSAGQLISAVGSGGYSTENLGYLYDAAQNLNKRTNSGTPTTFTVNTLNQLTGGPIGGNNYDWNGNLVSQTYDLSGPKLYNQRGAPQTYQHSLITMPPMHHSRHLPRASLDRILETREAQGTKLDLLTTNFGLQGF